MARTRKTKPVSNDRKSKEPESKEPKSKEPESKEPKSKEPKSKKGMSAAQAKKSKPKRYRQTFAHPYDNTRWVRVHVSKFYVDADGTAHNGEPEKGIALTALLPHTADGRPWIPVKLKGGGGGLTAEERAKKAADKKVEEDRVSALNEEDRAIYLAEKAAEKKVERDARKAEKKARLLAEAKKAQEAGEDLESILARLL